MNKTLRKALSAILAIVMILSCVPLSGVFANEDVGDDGENLIGAITPDYGDDDATPSTGDEDDNATPDDDVIENFEEEIAAIEAIEFDSFVGELDQEQIETAIAELVEAELVDEIDFDIITIAYTAATTTSAGSYTFTVSFSDDDVTAEITVEISKVLVTQENMTDAIAAIEAYDFGSFAGESTQDEVEAAIKSAMILYVSKEFTYGIAFLRVIKDFTAATTTETGSVTFTIQLSANSGELTAETEEITLVINKVLITQEEMDSVSQAIQAYDFGTFSSEYTEENITASIEEAMITIKNDSFIAGIDYEIDFSDYTAPTTTAVGSLSFTVEILANDDELTQQIELSVEISKVPITQENMTDAIAVIEAYDFGSFAGELTQDEVEAAIKSAMILYVSKEFTYGIAFLRVIKDFTAATTTETGSVTFTIQLSANSGELTAETEEITLVINKVLITQEEMDSVSQAIQAYDFGTFSSEYTEENITASIEEAMITIKNDSFIAGIDYEIDFSDYTAPTTTAVGSLSFTVEILANDDELTQQIELSVEISKVPITQENMTDAIAVIEAYDFGSFAGELTQDEVEAAIKSAMILYVSKEFTYGINFAPEIKDFTAATTTETGSVTFVMNLSANSGELTAATEEITLVIDKVIVTQEDIDDAIGAIEAYDFGSFETETTEDEITESIEKSMAENVSKVFIDGIEYQIVFGEYTAPTTGAAGSLTFTVELSANDGESTAKTETISVEIEKYPVTQEHIDIAVEVVKNYDFGSYTADSSQADIEKLIDEALAQASTDFIVGTYYKRTTTEYIAPTTISTGSLTFEVELVGTDVSEKTITTVQISKVAITTANISAAISGIESYSYNSLISTTTQAEAKEIVESAISIKLSPLYTQGLHYEVVTVEYIAATAGTNGSYVFAVVVTGDSYQLATKNITLSMPMSLTATTITSYSCVYDAIRINWNSVSGADGYAIYMYANGAWSLLGTVSSSTLTYRQDGLNANTSYKFYVKAYVTEGSTKDYGPSSSTYTASTKTDTVTMTTYSCTYDAIRINWNSVSGADGYRVYMLVDGSWKTVATVSSGILTYRISGLDANTEYQFKVKAYVRNDSGVAYWLDASAEYTASTKTSQVTMTTYTCTYDAIRINWNATSSADGYRVYMLVNGSWKSIATVSKSTLTYRISGLDANTEYQFKVKAYVRNDSGVACWLDASDAYIASTKTAKVTLTTYTCTTSAIRINWNSVSGADGYRIYMLVNGSWKSVATVSSSTLTYRISGLSSSTTYQFKVKAYVRNSDGTACWLDASNAYSAKTK